MNVGLFIDRLEVGGAQRQFALLADGLAGRGHRLTFFTLLPGGSYWDWLQARRAGRMLALYPVRGATLGHRLAQLADAPRRALQLLAGPRLLAHRARRVRRHLPGVLHGAGDLPRAAGLLPDGRLTMHVSKLHVSLIQEMHALTDVVIPGGHGNTLHHVWRHEGLAVQQGPVTPSGEPPPGTVRLRSTLRSFNIPSQRAGHWSIDVLTEDDQLVGRVPFEVIE